jgi:hypothetical protein
MNNLQNPIRLSFDEFKLYYDSTEKVTDRRLETNRWNYSICVAILIAIATITNWSLSTPGLVWVGLSSDIVLCLMALLFCALWVGQIRDFKKLNNAKFTVLNEMAPLVDFYKEKPGTVVSYCPFEKEWDKLSQLNALEEVRQSDIVALKSSNIEYFIPKAFGALYFAILLVMVVFITTHWPLSSILQTAPKVTSSNTP